MEYLIYIDVYRVKRRQALLGSNLPRDISVGLIARMRGRGSKILCPPKSKSHPSKDPQYLKKPQPEGLNYRSAVSNYLTDVSTYLISKTWRF